jgi:hypothetical protein
MTAEALAIVFSPNLLRAPQNDFVMILNNMGLSHKLVKALITHVRSLYIPYFWFRVAHVLLQFHAIFDESDPDGDGELHSEDELDSPIPEEAEEDEPSYEPAHDTHDDEPPFANGSNYTP